jgi:transposase InsO family protein
MEHETWSKDLIADAFNRDGLAIEVDFSCQHCALKTPEPHHRMARKAAAKWLWTYNNDRPNMGIGRKTPAMKLEHAKPLA